MNVDQLIEDGWKQHKKTFEEMYWGDDCRAAGEEGFALGVRHALAAMLPDRYTPREEVTEGWWSCVRSCSRTLVKVDRNFHGSLQVLVVNCDVPLPLEWFTDFLPVPAWLVEGIEKGENDAKS